MALSQFSEVRVSPAQGTVTITAQPELRYIPTVALLVSLYLMFEAGSVSQARSVRLAWAPLGPLVAALTLGAFFTGAGGGGGSLSSSGSGSHLGSAALFATVVAVGVAAVDILAPPPFPPPLFPPPLSVRASLVCGALLISTMVLGAYIGLRQADDAIARHHDSLERSIRLGALITAALCVADAGWTASFLCSGLLLLLWWIGVAWNAARQTFAGCGRRARAGGADSGGLDDTEDDDEPPSPDKALAPGGGGAPLFNRDFVCANYDPASDFHKRGADLATIEVAKLMSSDEFMERFHPDRLHPSRHVGLREVCVVS